MRTRTDKMRLRPVRVGGPTRAGRNSDLHGTEAHPVRDEIGGAEWSVGSVAQLLFYRVVVVPLQLAQTLV